MGPLLRVALCAAITLFLGFVSVSSSGRAECIDYGSLMRVLGGVRVPGTGEEVEVSGHHAFIVDGSLEIADVSDPAHPNLVADLDIPGYAADIAIRGSHAFVAAYANYYPGLRVIDITDPKKPRMIGRLDTDDWAWSVAVEGDLVYLGLHYSLMIVDVSEPANPRIMGRVDVPGWSHQMAVGHGYVALTSATAGLHMIDVTDPTSPRIVGNVDTPGSARAVAVRGHHAYVADGYHRGLVVIDITDPASPAVVGQISLPGYSDDVALKGPYAFVATGMDGMQVVDVSDPTSPRVVGSVSTWQGVNSARAALDLDGDCAYVVTEDGMQTIEIANPVPPPSGWVDTPSYAMDVAAAGDFAFVADGGSGLQVIDINDPGTPYIAGSVDTPGFAYAIALAGDYAGIADHTYFELVDVSDPISPAAVGILPLPFYALGVALADRRAYVGNYEIGVLVIDTSDPSNPQMIASVDTPGKARGLAISGSYLFVADGLSGLQVIDIGTTSVPRIVGTADFFPHDAWDIATQGAHACVTAGSLLYALDISNPRRPEILGSVGLPENGLNVSIRGAFAYVGNGVAGVQVVDISEPSAPRLVGGTNTPGHCWAAGVTASQVLLADDAEGFRTYPLQCGPDIGQGRRAVGRPMTWELGVTPNPSRGRTLIRLDGSLGPARVDVLNLSGALVRHIPAVREQGGIGSRILSWDGRDGRGRPVASGIYLVRVSGEEGSTSRQLTILR